MLKQNIEDALNKQIHAEIGSWYLYLSMAGFCEGKNLSGFGKWLKIQAEEEMSHAMKFIGYVNAVDGKVKLQGLEEPKHDWNSVQELFDEVREHEEMITNMINGLADLAVAEKDHATNNMLAWFVNEQVEEVATAKYIAEKLKVMAANPAGVYMMDRELGMRGK